MPPPKKHLTPADAVAIYQLSAARNNTKLIAERFGVSRRAVYDIWNRVSWIPETLPYWSAEHRLAYTSTAPPRRKRASITLHEAVAIYKARPHPAHMRSAARALAETVRYASLSYLFTTITRLFHILRARTHSQHTQLGVRPKTVSDVWNHVTWASATAPYRPSSHAPPPPSTSPPAAPISPS